LIFLISEACAVSTVRMMVVAASYEMVEKHAELNNNQRSESRSHVCSHVAEFLSSCPCTGFISAMSQLCKIIRLGCCLEGTKQNCKKNTTLLISVVQTMLRFLNV
jgi:hypothetical protein